MKRHGHVERNRNAAVRLGWHRGSVGCGDGALGGFVRDIGNSWEMRGSRTYDGRARGLQRPTSNVQHSTSKSKFASATSRGTKRSGLLKLNVGSNAAAFRSFAQRHKATKEGRCAFGAALPARSHEPGYMLHSALPFFQARSCERGSERHLPAASLIDLL